MEVDFLYDLGLKICIVAVGCSCIFGFIISITKKILTKKLNKDFGDKNYGK